ncbi:hypothetical protein AAFG13_35700 [Bradyrhizobium sp. B124]|uniref:hypothetical protein n=1 Tax=Bradyrhizobium sp. B124 TaxID=3140245 RepID=UPI003183460D
MVMASGDRTMIEMIRWRTEQAGPKQVVSGPSAANTFTLKRGCQACSTEIKAYLDWFNTEQSQDPVTGLIAGIDHVGAFFRLMHDRGLPKLQEQPWYRRGFSYDAFRVRAQSSRKYPGPREHRQCPQGQMASPPSTS